MTKTWNLTRLSFGFALAIWSLPVLASEIPCDAALAAKLEREPATRVVLVKAFKAGQPLVLSQDRAPHPVVTRNELCLVKLLVGPGNHGPAGAPSKSQGIGIEIWLPAADRWNARIHAMGGGGFQGGASSLIGQVGNPYAAMAADAEGAVTSTTDAGHATQPKNYGVPDAGGDFLMLPDSSANTALWRDFSTRAIHEQAVKTKAVARAYYGRPARFAYWEGSSTGGRQGLKLAQAHPHDFDGIIANLPAINWTRVLSAMAYPHIVYQRDLGGKPLSIAQLDLVSNAAIAACDLVAGRHLGYILDPSQCRYDPTRDPNVLCSDDGGRNPSSACVSRVQALAVNKIWYGPTRDGSVPDPAFDNGWQRLQGKHLWFGPARGTSLWNAYFTRSFGRPTGVANPETPPFLGTHQLALQGQNPSIADGTFRNATSDGADGWKFLSYADFSELFERGVKLNATEFADINTDSADLSAFEASGGKLLVWHGTNDEVIPVQGTTQYYDRVVDQMGGLDRVQNFYRLYVVPGAGHQSPNGTANPEASPPIFSRTGLYDLLTDWVERGAAPGHVELATPYEAKVRRTRRACLYPLVVRYVAGDPDLAASYECAASKKR